MAASGLACNGAEAFNQERRVAWASDQVVGTANRRNVAPSGMVLQVDGVAHQKSFCKIANLLFDAPSYRHDKMSGLWLHRLCYHAMKCDCDCHLLLHLSAPELHEARLAFNAAIYTNPLQTFTNRITI